LFEVLRTASQHHQVIVLTCRSRLFKTLGGTPLQITPWKVE
jgi:predicted ATPase